MAQNAVDYFRETDILLERWGRWCRSDGCKISYPSIATFAKEMPRDLEGSLALMGDDEAGEIEGAMLQLRGANLLLYKVTIYRYVHRRTIRDIAKGLKIGNEKARLEWWSAVHFIMGNLYKHKTD